MHTVTYAPIESIWSKVGKEVSVCSCTGRWYVNFRGIMQDKQKLLAEFRERNPDMDVAAFKRDVRNGALVQCCIRIVGGDRKADSLEFLREYGLLDGDGRGIAA